MDGILCVQEELTTYVSQTDYPLPEHEKLPFTPPSPGYLIYLDVWERHISYLEDGRSEDPNIREVALGGPDTATRAKVVQQVKVLPVESVHFVDITLEVSIRLQNSACYCT